MGRVERRLQLKGDQRRIARGLDVRNLRNEDLPALMRVLRRLVQSSINRRSVSPLMEFIYSNLAAGAEQIGDADLACARGCAHCCMLWVEATAPEVLFVVKQMGEAQRARAVTAVEIACGQTAGASFEARARVRSPCPLLEGAECSTYVDRPIVCRTAVSTDAEICRRSYLEFTGEEIPTPYPWKVLRQGYGVALQGALLNAGLAYQSRELRESLRVALTDRDAEANWLGGADVFAGLPMAPVLPIFTYPDWRAIYVNAFGSPP